VQLRSESEASGIYSRDKSITYDFNSIDSDVIFVGVRECACVFVRALPILKVV